MSIGRRAAIEGETINRIANELRDLEQKLCNGHQISGQVMEVSTAITRARYALIGLLNDGWKETASGPEKESESQASQAKAQFNTAAQIQQIRAQQKYSQAPILHQTSQNQTQLLPATPLKPTP